MKKKVLIIGPNFYNYNNSIAKAFDKSNFDTKIVSYDYDPKTFFEVLKNKFTYLKNNFLYKNKIYFNQIILDKYKEYSPNIVFVIKGDILNIETLLFMKNSIKILWMMDSVFINPDSYALLKYFDKIYLFEGADIDKLENTGIKTSFLPLCFDEDNYYPIDIEKDIDVFFAGLLNDYRLTFFYDLIDKFPDIKIKIFGKRFLPKNKPLKYFLNSKIFPHKKLSHQEINHYYNRAKICLNFHTDPSYYSANMRFFEIIGSGNLQLVEEKEFIKDYINTNIIQMYNSKEELFTKIKHILNKNTKVDKKIIRHEAVSNHTFYHRIKKVLDEL